MTISGFAAYVKQKWFNKPNTSSPLSAERLTHIEDGVKGNSDAIEKIAAAVISQITNDPDKIASMAALYSVNQAVTQLNSDFPYKLAARTFNAQQNPIDINPKETKPVKVDLSADGNACYGFICCLSGGITAYQLYNGAVTQYTIGIMNLSDSPISISGYIFYLMNK